MTRTPDEILELRIEQAETADWTRTAGDSWRDAKSLYTHLSQNTNVVAATRYVPWEDLLPEGAVVLDLGCGSGWLTSMLTTYRHVERVVAWDGSRQALDELLPAMVMLLNGDLTKVKRVCGDFSPLLLDDDSVDLLVMSSAFHHATDPDGLLEEMSRVLKPSGSIVLLNEVPYAVPVMLWSIARTALAAAINCTTNRVTMNSPGHVAPDHYLYDDVLGDRALTMSQWKRLFQRKGMTIEVIETPFPSYPSHYRRRYLLERNLLHFVLRPRSPTSPG